MRAQEKSDARGGITLEAFEIDVLLDTTRGKKEMKHTKGGYHNEKKEIHFANHRFPIFPPSPSPPLSSLPFPFPSSPLLQKTKSMKNAMRIERSRKSARE